jgi:hypothetical protein
MGLLAALLWGDTDFLLGITPEPSALNARCTSAKPSAS